LSEDGLELCDSLAALPAAAAALLDGPGRDQLFTSRPWLDSFVSAGLVPGAAPVFCVLGNGRGGARAMLPCQTLPRQPREPGVASLTSFYSCDFRPVIAAAEDPARTAFDLGRTFARRFAGEGLVRLDSLDTTAAFLAPFLAGLRKPGRAVLRYAHFGRWWEDLGGRGWDAYLASRDGALRETVRRKTARLARAGAGFEIVPAAEIERGIADYESVHAASWKEPEPFPAFQPLLMRNLARAGWLRLAVCRLDGAPIAAQIWTVIAGRATVLKLAHHAAFDRDSPGTALTAFAIGLIWASPARNPALVTRHLAGTALRRLRGD
jgi:hypothetical protein